MILYKWFQLSSLLLHNDIIKGVNEFHIGLGLFLSLRKGKQKDIH